MGLYGHPERNYQMESLKLQTKAYRHDNVVLSQVVEAVDCAKVLEQVMEGAMVYYSRDPDNSLLTWIFSDHAINANITLVADKVYAKVKISREEERATFY